MERCELPSSLGEGGEVLHLRDARQHFLQVGGELLAVVRAVQDAVDVEEDVVLGDLGAEGLLVTGKRDVRDVVYTPKAVNHLALAELPDNADLLYARALVAEKLNRIDTAEQDLRRILKKDPKNANALNALGYTLADRNIRLKEAREFIEKALKLAPDDPFILDSMGWVNYRMGSLNEGLEYLKRAYSQRPDPEIAAHLGEVLWVQGKKGEAEQLWRSAMKEHPGNDELKAVMKKFLN